MIKRVWSTLRSTFGKFVEPMIHVRRLTSYHDVETRRAMKVKVFVACLRSNDFVVYIRRDDKGGILQTSLKPGMYFIPHDFEWPQDVNQAVEAWLVAFAIRILIEDCQVASFDGGRAVFLTKWEKFMQSKTHALKHKISEHDEH